MGDCKEYLQYLEKYNIGVSEIKGFVETHRFLAVRGGTSTARTTGFLRPHARYICILFIRQKQSEAAEFKECARVYKYLKIIYNFFPRLHV